MLASCIWCPLAQAKGKWCLQTSVLIGNWLFTEYIPDKLILRFETNNKTCKKQHMYFTSRYETVNIWSVSKSNTAVSISMAQTILTINTLPFIKKYFQGARSTVFPSKIFQPRCNNLVSKNKKG